MRKVHPWFAPVALPMLHGLVSVGYGVPGIVTLTAPPNMDDSQRLRAARRLSRRLQAAGFPALAGVERHKSGAIHVHFGGVLPWRFKHSLWPEWSKELCGSRNAIDWTSVPVDHLSYAVKYVVKAGQLYSCGIDLLHTSRNQARHYINGLLFKSRGWYAVTSSGRLLYLGRVPAYCWEP